MSKKHDDRKRAPDSAAHDGDKAKDALETPAAETAPAGSPSGGGNAPETETESLKKELAAVKEKMLYLQADYQNYRKRALKDVADARMVGVTATLSPFLRVFDFLGMAQAAAMQSDNIEAIRQGIAMIIQEYVKAFDDLGVKRQDSVNRPFDPTWQEAVAQESSDTVPKGCVVREWAAAYRLGERLLRPAKVVISTGGAPEPSQTAKKEEED